MNTKSFLQNIALVAALAAGLMLSGCASGVKFAEYRATVKPCEKNQGRVWFYRPSAMGFAVQPAVDLDGSTVGHAVPGGFFHTETAPGAHEVSVTTEMKHKKTIAVAPGQETYVRLNMAMGMFVGHVIPVETPPEKALREMEGLHLAK